MRYIYKMQNLTFGSDGGLTKACQEKHPEEPGLCFMSPHMQDVIKTPFFSESVWSRSRVRGPTLLVPRSHADSPGDAIFCMYCCSVQQQIRRMAVG